jgi:hypothetical protein
MRRPLGVLSTFNFQLPPAKKSSSTTLCFSLLIVLHAATATAHHSFAAEYDGRKPATFSGTVTKVEWTNPHVHFFLDVKDPNGASTQWEFTMGAVNGLFRRGWNKEMLKPGDTVTVDGYLARDGSHLANARIVTLSDGRQMSGGTMPDGPAN